MSAPETSPLRTTSPGSHRLGRIAVVGAGRAGLSVATGLACAGRTALVSICRAPSRRRQVEHWIARGRAMGALPEEPACLWAVLAGPDPSCAQADTVVFATADRDLPAAARGWHAAGASRSGQVWLHLSGAQPPEVLEVAGGSRDLGSVHPLAALPDPLALPDPSPGMPPVAEAVAPLRGAVFALAGTEAATGRGGALARRLGGQPVPMPLDTRGAYHAAAALVANDLVGLLIVGEELATGAGMEPAVARRGLLHLARTALDALARTTTRPGATLAEGLTGAVGRGDAETLLSHMRALRRQPDGWMAHTALSRVLLRAVLDAGLLSPEASAGVERALSRRGPRRPR